MYFMIKHAHMGFAYLSITLFVLRGGLMLIDSPLLHSKIAKILPHIIDTLLLACAIALLVIGKWNPLQQPWILAKITGLILYVGLGTIALKRGKTKTIRSLALAASLVVVAYILMVAKTKLILPV